MNGNVPIRDAVQTESRKYLRKYSVKKHKEKPDRVYLAYKKVDNNRIEKEKRKVANDYLTQTEMAKSIAFLFIYVIIN
ncbi:MAG: hypothetical protein ACLRR3_00550 [Eubacterium sp.]